MYAPILCFVSSGFMLSHLHTDGARHSLPYVLLYFARSKGSLLTLLIGTYSGIRPRAGFVIGYSYPNVTTHPDHSMCHDLVGVFYALFPCIAIHIPYLLTWYAFWFRCIVSPIVSATVISL